MSRNNNTCFPNFRSHSLHLAVLVFLFFKYSLHENSSIFSNLNVLSSSQIAWAEAVGAESVGAGEGALGKYVVPILGRRNGMVSTLCQVIIIQWDYSLIKWSKLFFKLFDMCQLCLVLAGLNTCTTFLLCKISTQVL